MNAGTSVPRTIVASMITASASTELYEASMRAMLRRADQPEASSDITTANVTAALARR